MFYGGRWRLIWLHVLLHALFSLTKKNSSGDLWLVWTTNPIVEGRSKRSDLNLVNRTFLTIKDFV